ncbi:MAG: lipoyl synthase, partial [Acidimicrobiia bacterium]|nr:lipoyl synthase [Acidimicrobiia bacterium]
VPYTEAWDLQQRLFDGDLDHLLLCEHTPVYTLGRSGNEANVLVPPADVGAELHRVNRGGDVTFHGPGQLVGYPVLSVPGRRGGGLADTVAYVTAVEQLLIEAIGELGLDPGRIAGSPGVWLDPDGPAPRKVAAVGVRLSRGRSMHGFGLNVSVDLDWFRHIVPCGIADKGVTSLAAEGVDATMEEVVDLVVAHAAAQLAPGRAVERQDVAWRHRPEDLAPFSRGAGGGDEPTSEAAGVPVRLRGRLAEAGVTGGLPISDRKPSWMRVELQTGPDYLRLKKVARSLELTTVCEEAGCPNIFDCWNEGTATFMLLGDRCTRACGFCLIDTRKPRGVDDGEPQRVADAVRDLGLDFAVLTMVARDDLDDGGAEIVARTVEAIRQTAPGAGVEVLISDLRGDPAALATVCASGPDVVNHNIETVARLQRAVRPSAGYARSLATLARAKGHGSTTKSGVIVGMGETVAEVQATMADLAAVGVDIVTIGQYLRPTTNHLPLHRWWAPDEFAELKAFGENTLGIAHVESSPLTRSSHHAGSAATAATRRAAR